MLSGRGKKEYAKEAQAVAETGPDGLPLLHPSAPPGSGEDSETLQASAVTSARADFRAGAADSSGAGGG